MAKRLTSMDKLCFADVGTCTDILIREFHNLSYAIGLYGRSCGQGAPCGAPQWRTGGDASSVH